MPIPPLPPNLKDWTEVIAPAVVVLGALAAGWKGLQELRLSREQRALERQIRDDELTQHRDELNWKRAHNAKQLNLEMYDNHKVVQMIHMLDWPGDDIVEVGADEQSTVYKVTRSDFREALSRPKEHYTTKQQFICECLDDFMYYLAEMESAVRSRLVDFDTLVFPTDYYVSLLANDKDVVDEYLKYYDLGRARSFLDRFPTWKDATPRPLRGFDDVFTGAVLGTAEPGSDSDGRRNRLLANNLTPTSDPAP